MRNYKICLLLIFLFFIFACGKQKGFIDKGRGKKIKIGVILSLSGELSPIGQMLKEGIELAVEEINLIGGVDDSELELVFFDDQGDPVKSANGAEKFFTQGDIPVIIGSVSNECTIAIASFTSKVRMPMISPAASRVGITGIGPYTFRNSLTDYEQAKSIAEHAFTIKNIRTFAVIYPNNNQGITLNKIFTQRIQEIGGKVIANEMYEEPAGDFSTLLKKLKVIEPQAIYFPGKKNDILLITRQAYEAGLNVIFLGTNEWAQNDIISFGGDYVSGAIYTAAFYKDSNQPLVRNFIRRFKKKFNKEPDGWAAQGYDVVRIVIQAMFAGSKDRQGIKDGLLKVINFPGVTGRTSFKPTGEVEKEVIILGIYNGEILQLQ